MPVHAIGDNGGVLDIEVQDADIDHAEKNDFLDLEVGSYVRISVNDTGYGMHPDVMRRIFDPYFTTKEKGVGHWLGPRGRTWDCQEIWWSNKG